MRLRRAARCAVRGFALAALLVCCGTLAALPAAAFEPSSGNKNFTSPQSVPDYFSNEAGPFGRGPRTATPDADRFNIAPSNTGPGVVGTAHAATSQPAPSAGRAAYRLRPARGGTARHFASSRSRARHARHAAHLHTAHRHAGAASRHSVATGHRAAAGRPRYAAHSARQSRRVLR